MTNRVFKKTPLALAVSLAVGNTAYGQEQGEDASAAEDESPNVEEMVVYGIRQSLKNSMDLKRARDGIVDAITAEDIGDFPDTNLAESLQRITGVSIDRERGEGKSVTVRGFGPPFNLVLLNGRQMPTNSGLNRSFDFGDLASEAVSAVEVYKTGQANVPTGGIGSTLNIRTTRPLDAPGLNFTAAASGLHDRSTEEGSGFTPEVSALFSNTFNDDRAGVALSIVRQDRNNGANTGSVAGWRTFPGEVHNCWGCAEGRAEWGGIPPAGDPNQVNRPGDDDLYSVPQGIGYEIAEYERQRTNGQLTLQFEATEDLTATLDYTFSEVELERTYNTLSAWFNFGGQETVWTDGPQATPLVYTDSSANDFVMNSGQDAWKTRNGAVGLNLLWDVSDRLSLEFDYHDSTAERAPNSPYGDSANLAISAYSRDRTTAYFGSDLPVLELTLGNPLTPDDMIVSGSVFANNFAKMNISQTKLAGNYSFNAGFVESIDFGVELTEVDNRAAGATVQRDAWGGVTQPGAIADLLTPASAAGAFDEVPGGGDPRRQSDYYTWNMAEVVARTEALMASGEATIFELTDMGDCGTGLCTSSRFTADRRTAEESTAVYAQANMATELAYRPVDIRVGIRFEKTDVSSRALSPAYVGLNWVAGNELTPVQAVNPEFSALDGDYDVVLPNVDFKIGITDDMVGRFSYSETITRPNYTDIQGGQTIDSPVRVGGGTGNRGNPALLPFESQNIDLSFEYYYGDDSYAAVGYFIKDVENFIGTSSVTENTFNLPHPALGPLGDAARAATGSSDGGALYGWILENRADEPGVDAENGVISGVAGRDPVTPFNLTVPVNIEKAQMKGWELVVQHAFGDTGFGAIVNATIVDADVGYDNFSLEQQFVLTGLSDSANAIAYYDKDGIGVRLAYNWRDAFLAGTGQVNVGAGPPTYVAAYQQLDLSASYRFNDNMQLYADVLNLTNETTHVYGRHEYQTLFAAQSGMRFNLGFRYKL